MLKTSARNCKFHLSLMLNFLNREVSNSVRPGPVNDPRDTFPKVPGVCSTKAVGLYHWVTFPTITGPLKVGFRLGTSEVLGSPVPEIFEPASGVKGKPLWAVRMPFHC